MKKALSIFLVILFFTLFIISCTVEENTIEWQYMYGGNKLDTVTQMEKTSDGGYIMVGRIAYPDEWTDVYVVKTNGNGEFQWDFKISGNLDDEIYDVIEAHDGGYILVGDTRSTDIEGITNFGVFDALIVKLSVNGSLEWIKNIGGTGSENFYSISKTSDGGYIACGNTYSKNIGLTIKGICDYYVVKFTSDFQIEWQKNYGGSEYSSCYSIKQTSDGGYIIVGESTSRDIPGVINHDDEYEGEIDPSSYGDIYVIKTDSNGNIEWHTMYGGNYLDTASNVFQTKDGGLMLLGTTYSTKIYDTELEWCMNLFILKINDIGEKEWYYIAGDDNAMGSSWVNDMIELSDGGYLFAGSTSAENICGLKPKGQRNIYIFKLNNSGKFVWNRLYGGYGLSSAARIIPTDDGKYVCGGSATDIEGLTGFGYSDFYIFKFFE